MSVPAMASIPSAATPAFEDCTVTAVSPLRIQRDADSTPMAFTPRTLVDPVLLTIGDRVRVDLASGNPIVLGRAGGVPVAVAATPSTLALRDAAGRTKFADPAVAADAATKGYVDAGYRLAQTVYFTSSGSFAKASYPTARAIRVRVAGGGGAGGGAAATGANWSIGAGGGGGGYAEKFITDIAGLATSETVTVGAGGAAASGTTGGRGGTSSFGTQVIASGGVGGAMKPANVYGPYISGGLGGVGSAGDLLIRGGGGTTGGGYSDLGSSGAGGSSQLGGGAPGVGAGSGYVAGVAGGNYGGGGGGAYNSASQSARGGGAGAAGIVIVEVFA